MWGLRAREGAYRSSSRRQRLTALALPLPPPPLSLRSGHCKKLAPKWRSVAQALHGIIKVTAVNCEKEEALCQQNGVQSYPAIKAYRCPACPAVVVV